MIGLGLWVSRPSGLAEEKGRGKREKGRRDDFWGNGGRRSGSRGMK